MAGQIREFTSPINSLQPSERGPNSYEQLAGVERSSANQIGATIGGVVTNAGKVGDDQQKKVDDAEYQRELVTGAAAYGTLMMNLSTERDEYLKAHGDDPNATQNFMKIAQDRIDAFTGSFNTDRGKVHWAERGATATVTLFNSTAADASNIAAAKVSENADLYAKARAQYAYRNPGELQSVLDDIKITFTEFAKSHNIDGPNAAKITNDLVTKAQSLSVVAAFNRMIEVDAPGFLKAYAKGDFEQFAGILGPVPYKQAKDAAEAQIEQDKRKADADRTALEKSQKIAVDAGITKLYTSQIGPDGTFTLTGDYWDTVKQIANMPGVSREDTKAMMDMGRTIQDKTGATVNDPYVYDDFKARMSLPFSDPRRLTPAEVFRAGAEHKLIIGQEGTGLFLGAIGATDPATAAAQKDFDKVSGSFKSAFTRTDELTGFRDAQGDIKYQQFLTEFQSEFESKRIGGTGPGAHNIPAADLLDFRNQNYIFKRLQNLPASDPLSALPGYKGDTGILNAPRPSWSPAPGYTGPAATPTVAPPAPKAAPRNPGESPDDYLKRIQASALPTAIPANAPIEKAVFQTTGGGFLPAETPNTKQAAVTVPPVATPDKTIVAETDQPSRAINAQGFGDKITGSMSLNGKTYDWVSGGGGRGSLPYGTYKITAFTSGAERAKAGYTYTKDAFMLSNVHDTAPGAANGPDRTGLLIHSDGLDRSAGCINIQGGDFGQFTKDLKVELAKNGGEMFVTVGPHGTQVANSNAQPPNPFLRPTNVSTNPGAVGAPAPGQSTAFLLTRLQPGKPAADIKELQPQFQDRLAQLFQAAPPEIRDGLQIISGARDHDEQKVLWDRALKKYGSAAEARKWVAPPGSSVHESGLAADVGYKGGGLGNAPAKVVAYLHENAAKYGLKFPLSNENWHIEAAETRGGQPYKGEQYIGNPFGVPVNI